MTRTRMQICSLLIYLSLLAIDTLDAQDMNSTCRPQKDNLQPGQRLSIRPGRYRLTLVAILGSQAGSVADGTMWLLPTTSHDRSSRTGRIAAPTDTNAVPFYGATDLPFDRIGAPMLRDSLSDPTSRDPVYPGVLVEVTQPSDSLVLPSLELLIGTLSNQRTEEIKNDGGGIGLETHALTQGELYGGWGPYGIVSNGSGYFCARYLGP